VNRYLLDAMARLGNGTSSYLSLNERAEPVMSAYFERISHPALTDVHITFATQGSGMKVTETYPQRLPELFVGKPIIITGQFTGTPVGDVLVTGRVGERKMQYQLSAAGSVEQNPAIAAVWARAKITDLHDESIYEGRDVTADVKTTALTYGLMSDYTSFVAVDSTRVTEGDRGVRVSVPVPVPEGGVGRGGGGDPS
jgi:Ca-activated chloride channel family protein